MSYINRNRARQTGTNRTSRPKSPTRFGWVFRGGSQAEISNTFWLGFPGRVMSQDIHKLLVELPGANASFSPLSLASVGRCGFPTAKKNWRETNIRRKDDYAVNTEKESL
jgi:hypothetical protein